MKIEKKGNKIIAYRDENDVNSKCGTGFNSNIKIGDSLGSINLDTNKFTGNTVCLLVLKKEQQIIIEKKQKLIDEVIKQVVSDAEQGDTTVIDELLKNVSEDVLIQSLPEEMWETFR